MSAVNKVDMSLDDIIKLNKKENSRQRGRGRGRGQGRGNAKFKEFRSSLRGRGFRRGQQSRGNWQRGRGTGKPRLRRLSGVSPLNRDQGENISTQNQGRGLQSLNKRRQQALQALQSAKRTLAQINAQSQQRQNLVNTNRGLQNEQQQFSRPVNRNFTPSRGRGRGRGRGQVLGRGRGQVLGRGRGQVRGRGAAQSGLRTRGRGRGRLTKAYYSQNLSGNVSSFVQKATNKQRRRWRKRPTPVSDDGILTVSVSNPSAQAYGSSRSLEEQIKNLKPPVSRDYKFNKNFFSRGTSNLTLSDRFGDANESNSTGRKVFL